MLVAIGVRRQLSALDMVVAVDDIRYRFVIDRNRVHSIPHTCVRGENGELIFIDGVDQAWTAINFTNPGSGAVNDKVYLASRALTSLFWNGKIRAFLLYSPKLSSGDSALVETYLGKHIP